MTRFQDMRNREGRILPAGEVEYRLYNTPVVTISACGRTAKLRHGGHVTATTRRAINEVLEALMDGRRVIQQAGVWYVAPGLYFTGATVPFIDGMTIILR